MIQKVIPEIVKGVVLWSRCNAQQENMRMVLRCVIADPQPFLFEFCMLRVYNALRDLIAFIYIVIFPAGRIEFGSLALRWWSDGSLHVICHYFHLLSLIHPCLLVFSKKFRHI